MLAIQLSQHSREKDRTVDEQEENEEVDMDNEWR